MKTMAYTMTFILLTAALTGCMTMTGEGGQFNMLSTQEEVEIGQEVAVEIEKQEKLLANPDVQAYVTSIGQRLARVAPRQDVQYTFKVIDAPDTVNAFALPGGFMYVYTGLMKICENEAELAAVMAHEIGHVSCHHHGESMTRQYGINIVSSILLGDSAGKAAQMAADLIGTAGMMRFSRVNEYEADQMGMEILFRAGYKPDAMVSFMNKLLAQEGASGGAWLPIFSSHPPTQERLESLQTLAQKYPLNMRESSPTYAERYQEQALTKLK